MGYVYESAVYKLVFEGRFAGLEVYAQELSLQELLDFSALMWIDMTMATAEERVRARTQFMLDHIDRWNLEDSFQGDTKRTPVPLKIGRAHV